MTSVSERKNKGSNNKEKNKADKVEEIVMWIAIAIGVVAILWVS